VKAPQVFPPQCHAAVKDPGVKSPEGFTAAAGTAAGVYLYRWSAAAVGTVGKSVVPAEEEGCRVNSVLQDFDGLGGPTSIKTERGGSFIMAFSRKIF
jgi:hypothetical protein